MKKGDSLWVLALLVIVAFFVFPATSIVFTKANQAHPYLLGFVKFAILATMGELLALRIVGGEWKKPVGLVYRAIIWGFLGMTFVLIFNLFAAGVAASIQAGLIPKIAGKIGPAFFTSALMNLTFAPTFMAFHRITDTFIDLGEGKISKIMKVRLRDVVAKIDWQGYVSFVVLKTVPLFWIPAHTITFLVPPDYRVLLAAFLSIALGGILSFAKKRSVSGNNVTAVAQ